MKQHYVPRCYLRQFSDNPKSIFAYDKVSSKSYRASLMSVCCEEDMYSLSDSYLKECNENNSGHLDRLSIEHEHFADFVEPNFSKMLKDIDVIKNEWMTDKEHYRLSFIEKREIALHLVTQFFRLPEMKRTMVDDFVRMDRANVDMLKHILAKQYTDESFEKLKIDMTRKKDLSYFKEGNHDYLLQKGFDMSDIYDLRNYRDGDDIRHIHWKLSAKMQQMLLKEGKSNL